jgi:hypothetical protein
VVVDPVSVALVVIVGAASADHERAYVLDDRKRHGRRGSNLMGGRAWTPPWDKGGCARRKRSGRLVAKPSSFAYLPNITYDTLSVREAGALRRVAVVPLALRSTI